MIRGVSEDNLDAQINVLKKVYGIDVLLGAPQVAYRETFARATQIDYTHKKQMGGTGEFARVKLKIEPNQAGTGNEFESEIIGGAVPKEYIAGVEKGVQSVWDSGVLIGFPMVATKVVLFDGDYHEVDSSAIAFEIAARRAMCEGANQAGVKLLQPIMDVEVECPGDFVGTVIGDINSRRGHVLSQEMRDDATVIKFVAPLACLLGYRNGLSSITNRRGRYSMRFSHYDEVPRNIDPDDFPPSVGMRA